MLCPFFFSSLPPLSLFSCCVFFFFVLELQSEIKKAWKKLAAANHPDRNKGDKDAEAAFIRASEAYNILSDPEKKREWDYGGRGGGGRGGGGRHQRQHHQNPFFNQFFQQQQQQQRRPTPYADDRDAHLSMRVLQDVVKGSELRPTLVQFMHSSVRYYQPQTWKELTDDIKALGILVGVVDHAQMRQAFEENGVTDYELRGYYRGRLVRGPVIGYRSTVAAIKGWVHNWLAGVGMEAMLFGPALGPPVLSSASDVPPFVVGNEDGSASDQPWRAKIVYVAAASDGKHGSNSILAAAWKYKWLADFAILAPPGGAGRSRPQPAGTARKKFYRLHSIVAAPALVVFWPANKGTTSSGTLNAHSLTPAQIQGLMSKIDATGQRKRLGKTKTKSKSKSNSKTKAKAKIGTGLGKDGATDGKGDELPWTNADTAWWILSELYLAANTMGAPGLMMIVILLLSGFLHVFVPTEREDDRRARTTQHRQTETNRLRRDGAQGQRQPQQQQQQRPQTPEQRAEELRAQVQRSEAKVQRWRDLQLYLPGGGAGPGEAPSEPMLPRHARLDRVLESPGVNIVLLKSGQPFRWEMISCLDVSYYNIFDHFSTAQELNFFESRQEWFGPTVLARCNEIQRNGVACVMHGKITDAGRDPAEVEASASICLVAVRNKVRENDILHAATVLRLVGWVDANAAADSAEEELARGKGTPIGQGFKIINTWLERILDGQVGFAHVSTTRRSRGSPVAEAQGGYAPAADLSTVPHAANSESSMETRAGSSEEKYPGADGPDEQDDQGDSEKDSDAEEEGEEEENTVAEEVQEDYGEEDDTGEVFVGKFAQAASGAVEEREGEASSDAENDADRGT